MFALILIPLALALAFSGLFDAEISRVAEENGLEDFDPNAPSLFDDSEVDFGTNMPDTLTGTNGEDALFALGQADIVNALAGDDLVEAGSNNDTVLGGAGDDIIGGGTGFDLLNGQDGDDALLGNGGDDLFLGRAGDDLLIGGGGTDSLNGGPGDDVLISGNVVLDEEGEQDVSATALAVVRNTTEEELASVDFDALREEGALNGVDVSFLEEAPEPTQGGDLRGGDGDDLLILAGGDTAQGGAGEDLFVLNENMVEENTVRLVDYTSADDVIAVQYAGDDAPVLDTRDRGEDAIILIGEDILALVEGGAGISAADIRLVQDIQI
jgi:Ca2+-binding RTX toxin-like protein